jgi:hypothetical protein
MRLVSPLAAGLHRLLDLGEEGFPILPLDVLNPQVVVAQVETPQTFPEARACLAEAVRLRHIPLRAATGDAVVALAAEATASVYWLAVGGEPHRIDRPIGVG